MSFRRIGMIVGLLTAGTIATAWFGREPLLAWYYTHRLATADDGDVERWTAALVASGSAVEARLWDLLNDNDATRCHRIGQALVRRHADRLTAFAAELAARAPKLSPAGQAWALRYLADDPSADPAIVGGVIELGARHADATVRAQAVRTAARLGRAAPEAITAMIQDPDPLVRQAVIVNFGSRRELLCDDDLLPRLHDVDRTVQRLARTALRSRGLTEQQVQMGRLLTDPRPAARLQLIAILRDDSDLDLSTWLRRLSQDPSPAVRAAAARTAAELQVFQLADRLSEMAESDPDLTVRPIADFHLRQIRTVRPASFEPQP